MAYDAFTRQFLTAWNAHDADAAAALMTDDYIFEPSVGIFPWGARIQGRSGIRIWAIETFHNIPDIHWELVHKIVGDSHAVFEYQVTGTPNATESFDVYACDILTIHNGLISSKRAYRKARP